MTASGTVTFRIGEREYATALQDVREVVRLQGLADLPGMAPPLAGVLDLRGEALPVLDLRGGRGSGAPGDVLVLARGGGPAGSGTPVGVAVDEVRAVLAAEALVPAGTGDAGVLPPYVVRVLRHAGSAGGVVFLVDLEQMVASARGQAVVGAAQT